MADKYVDHGLYTYAATPTWGTAQEGDGTASGAATPATASVVFTGIPNTGTIQVLGITVSPTWVTSSSVCADNLAAAINAATSTATGPASFTTKSQVRDHVYARGPSNGAAANTCEIMTRQGSASHNGLVAVAHTLNNVSTGSPVNFSGGAGGAWGWLQNCSATIWPSGIGICGYGLFASYTGVFFCGALAAGDIVHMRTKRSGSSITLNYDAGATRNIYVPVSTNGSAPIVFKADPGVKWASDDGTLTFSIASGVYAFNLNLGAAGTAGGSVLVGKSTSETVKGIAFVCSVDWVAPSLAYNQYTRITGARFRREWAANYPYAFTINLSTGTSNTPQGASAARFVSCQFYHAVANYPLLSFNSWCNNRIEFIDCDFRGSTGAASSAFSFDANAVYQHLTFDGCRWNNFYAGSNMTGGSYGNFTDYGKYITFRNCDFGNVGVFTGGLVHSAGYGYGNQSTLASGVDVAESFVTVQNTLPGRRYYMERSGGILEWNPASSWPTLSALLPETYSGGLQKWVYRYVTNVDTTELSPVAPRRAFAQVKFNTLGTSQLTAALFFLVDNNIESARGALKDGDVQIRVTYRDASDVVHTDSSYDVGATRATLASTSVGWSATNYDISSIRHDYTQRKVTLTTSAQVKDQTEVYIEVLVGVSCTAVSDWFFFDPEVNLATYP